MPVSFAVGTRRQRHIAVVIADGQMLISEPIGRQAAGNPMSGDPGGETTLATLVARPGGSESALRRER